MSRHDHAIGESRRGPRSSIAEPRTRPTSALRSAPRRSLAALLATVALAGSGCNSDPTTGYSTDDTFRSDVRTISLPIFVNATYVEDVQFELADALVKEVEATTPWKLASGATADTVLSGRIVNVEIKRIAKSPTTGLAEQDTVTIVVDFEWRDQRTGTTLVRRERFAASGLFVPTRTSAEPIEFGRWAAVEALARDIVGELRSDW